ncbi:MAG TPA: LemA family protein [Cytophagales bacterium]|nr:LemA family protein [Cytophagales bacterium]
MKKLLIGIGIFLVVAFIIYKVYAGMYNGAIAKEENVKASWGQVENQYQRRADLIPNLVNTVKGSASHERETLTQVIQARSKATSVNVDPANLTPENIQQFEKAQAGLSSALSRLLVVVEKYPDLKANQNFRDLQAQLEGTENRISTERRSFNLAVQDYNTYVRSFPQRLFLGAEFSQKGTFAAAEGADKAPTVQF